MSSFEIAGRQLESRLILGTGGFRNLQVMAEAARESGAELATVAMRRVDPSARGSIVEVLEETGLEVLPEVGELELVSAKAGLRPGTPDNTPIVGPDAELDGLIWATGHWRNGVLLAPVTGDAVADLLTGLKGSDPFRRVEGLRA